MMGDQKRDEQLGIETAKEQIGFPKSFHHHRYEATPYPLLDLLFEAHPFSKDTGIVDFGCGKGRLNFAAFDRFGCRATGVEMNETYYAEALNNLESFQQKHRKAGHIIRFEHCLAESYAIQPSDDCFYFFNPFSAELFMKVVGNILASYEQQPRRMHVILFYPSIHYIDFLENRTVFELEREVVSPGIRHNPHERFLIYTFG